MLSRDDIIRMADKAGLETCRGDGWPDERLLAKLKHFAALVAAAEREACARVCEENAVMIGARDCAAAIRSRGQTPAHEDEEYGNPSF